MATVTTGPAASEDDCYDLPTAGGVNYTAGADNAPGSGAYQGVRCVVTGPANGDTIDSAFIRYASNFTSGGNQVFGWNVYADDVDDAADFASGDAPSSRTWTTAFVDWTDDIAATTNVYMTSPDIKTVIQEIIDRPGWVSGNHMAILMEGTFGTRFSVYYWDHVSGNAPQLEINYTAAGGGASKTTISILISPNLINGAVVV